MDSIRSFFSPVPCCKKAETDAVTESKASNQSPSSTDKKSASCFTRFLSCLSSFNCCKDAGPKGRSLLEDEPETHSSRATDKKSFCRELLKESKESISSIFFVLALDWKNDTVNEDSALPIKFIASAVLSSVSLVTIPLSIIEGVARRIFGWTLSLLNRVLPFGNDFLIETNRTFFDNAIRIHLALAFTAFDNLFAIFEPQTEGNSIDIVMENSVFLQAFSVTDSINRIEATLREDSQDRDTANVFQSGDAVRAGGSGELYYRMGRESYPGSQGPFSPPVQTTHLRGVSTYAPGGTTFGQNPSLRQ